MCPISSDLVRRHLYPSVTDEYKIEHDDALVHQGRGFISLNDHLAIMQVALIFPCGQAHAAVRRPFSELEKTPHEHRADLRDLLAVNFERHGTRDDPRVRAITAGDVALQQLTPVTVA